MLEQEEVRGKGGKAFQNAEMCGARMEMRACRIAKGGKIG